MHSALRARNFLRKEPDWSGSRARGWAEIMNVINHPIRRAVSDAEFCAWLGSASAGAIFEYYRGFLLIDADRRCRRMIEPERQELVHLRRRVWWASEQGFVHLVQRRLAFASFAYLAVVRQRPAYWPDEFPPLGDDAE